MRFPGLEQIFSELFSTIFGSSRTPPLAGLRKTKKELPFQEVLGRSPYDSMVSISEAYTYSEPRQQRGTPSRFAAVRAADRASESDS